MKILFGLLLLMVMSTEYQGAENPLPSGVSMVENGSFNSTGNRLAGWLMRSGGYGSFELTAPQTGSPDPVLTMKVRKGDPKPWLMELRQPVARAVEKGRILYISFEYKMTEGYGFQFYWQEERPPWPKLLSLRLTTPVNAWHRIRVAAPVHNDYTAGSTSFSFHLAETAGVLQLRNFYAVQVPEDVGLEDLEINETAVLGGDFYDRVWREKIQARLLETRGLPLKVKVCKRRPGARHSRNHPPAAEAVVILKQLDRPFKLGVAANASLLFPEVLQRPEHAALAQQLGNSRPRAAEYRKRILENPLFSFISCPELFAWRSHDLWGKQLVGQVAEAVKKAGKHLLGGHLYTPRFDVFPDGMRQQEQQSILRQLMTHIAQTVEKQSETIDSWTVLNDVIANSEVYTYIGVESLPQAFATAARSNGKARLYLSDSQALSSISDFPLHDLVELVVWLQQTGGIKVDGLCLGACMRRLDVAPQTLEKRLDYLRERLPDMPLHITNLAVNMPKETLQGEMLRDYLLLFYSHPAVTGVSLGELWTPALELPALGYLREDFSPKPAYEMVRKLFAEEWLSTAELKTDHDGEAQCRLFAGTYRVVVAFETQRCEFNITIPANKQEPDIRKTGEQCEVSLKCPDHLTGELNIFLEPERQ